MDTTTFFNQAPITYFDSQNAALAVRTYGNGPALIFVHGFPTHGYTWRHILPKLAKKYTCYVLDMPGLGESKWEDNTDFHFRVQAQRIIDFIKAQQIENCTIIAHDTGATTVRFVALNQNVSVEKLILINTEIPYHRPPWIQLYQLLSKMPFAHYAFRATLSSGLYVRSPMGFRAFYADKKLLKKSENLDPYVKPLTSSNRRNIGAFKYLRGIDFKYLDTLKEKHKDITAKVLLIWGTQDVTFPIQFVEKMLPQFKDAHLFRLENASLMPHEEQPEEVLKIILNN